MLSQGNRAMRRAVVAYNYYHFTFTAMYKSMSM